MAPFCRHTGARRFAPFIALVVAVAMFVGTRSAHGEEPRDLTGHWEGAIKTPGRELEVNIDFEPKDGAWSGDISIPVQNAHDLPLKDISFEDGRAKFIIVGVPGEPTFSGELSADGKTISGDFTQGGQTIPFTLARGPNLAKKAVERLKDFDAFVEKAREDWKAPGFAMGIVVEDQVVFSKGFGQRDREKDLPVTTKTLFAIGSCSKAFTTFVLGTLVDEGVMEWDKPVLEYLPSFRLYDKYATMHITPRDLVTHRSGLPRHDLVWYNSPASREELVERLRYLKPNHDLREEFQYNNLMFMTAGYLAGQLTGGTWEDAVRYRVFAPIGMAATNFSVEESKKTDDYALPYEDKDDEIRLMNFRNIDNVGPAGSINSNVEDMLRWVRVHLGKGKIDGRGIIEEATLRDMHTPHMAIATLPDEPENSPMSYAMGWMVNTYQGHYRAQHGGGIDGFTALVTLYPYDRVGIVALANMSGSALPGLASKHAADKVLGLKDRDWNIEALKKRDETKDTIKEAEKKKDTLRTPDTTPAHALDAYAGVYHDPGYGDLTIELDGERLDMIYNGIRTPFEHWHYEVFNGLENTDDHTFEDARIRFLTNNRGEVDGVAMTTDPLVDEIIFKRKPDTRMSDPEYLARFVGKFEIMGQTFHINLRGKMLTVNIPGQGQIDLVPERDDEFTLKDLTGFSVKFFTNDEGNMIARFNQPNGVFDAKRLEE